MMQKLANLSWFFIFLLSGWEIFKAYDTHVESKSAQIAKIPVLESKLKSKKKEQRNVKVYLQDIEKAKARIEVVAQEVEKLQKKLPEAISDTDNLALIQGISKKLNIQNVLLAPGIEENKGFYFAKRYEMTGSGTFLQFLILLERISSVDRILNVREVDFEKSKEKQRGRFQLINCKLVIEAYRYNPDHKEDRGIEKIESEGTEKKANPGDKGKRRRRRRG
jgi:Tfp pilus assembly protein PilO